MGGALTVIATSAKSDFISKFTIVHPLTRLLVIMCTNLFSMYFFFLLASYVGNPNVSPEYVIIGNVVQSVSTSTLYSATNISGTEKHTGTLEPILSSPSRLFFVFFGKSIFSISTGFVSVSISLLYAAFLFGVDFSSANIGAVALICVLTCLSLAGMGLAIGSIGIYLRTSAILANLFGYIGLLICGVNFPISYLPEWLQLFSYGMPLTYAVEATRSAVDGSALAVMAEPLLVMVSLGIVYLIAAWFVFGFFEKISRKRGSLDSF
ncbi:MAG: ABC transporter permease [Candidatus Methanomethylophilaceae archaeon]|nr:type transport system permease protein [Candidatus Methanomethylophilaceae archaeon]